MALKTELELRGVSKALRDINRVKAAIPATFKSTWTITVANEARIKALAADLGSPIDSVVNVDSSQISDAAKEKTLLDTASNTVVNVDDSQIGDAVKEKSLLETASNTDVNVNDSAITDAVAKKNGLNTSTNFVANVDDSQITNALGRLNDAGGSGSGGGGGGLFSSAVGGSLAGTFGTVLPVLGLAAGLKGIVDQTAAVQTGLNEIASLQAPNFGFDEANAVMKAFNEETRLGIEQNIPALYDAISAGVPPNNALDFLVTSSKLAVAGVSDTGTAVDVLTSSLNAYGDEAFAVEDISTAVFATIQGGKCVVGSTRVLLSDGRYERIDALQDGADVVSYDGRGWVKTKARWVDQGKKETRIMVTHLGRRIETTPEHPYLSIVVPDGKKHQAGWNPRPEWRRVDELNPGDRIAVPTHLSFFGDKKAPDHEAALLGLWLAEGASNIDATGVRITTTAYGDYVEKWGAEWGLKTRNVEKREGVDPSYAITGERDNKPNPLMDWLRGIGLGSCTAATKHVPAEVFTWDRESVAVFLRWLFNGDGWLSKSPNANRSNGFAYQLGFVSNSEQLVRDVSHLLLRFGVVGRIRYRQKVNAWVWETSRNEEMRRFVEQVGIDRPAVEDMMAYVPAAKRRGEVVEYDKIVSIEVGGVEQVYDLCVPGLENFVAEDVVAHNTTLDELGPAFARVIPAAAALDVNVNQLSAAFQLMTSNGINSNETSTKLNALFLELNNSTLGLGKAFNEVSGQSFAQFSQEGGTVGEALALITSELGLTQSEFINLAGSAEAGSAGFILASNNGQKFASVLDATNQKIEEGVVVNNAYAINQQGLAATLDRVRGAIEGLVVSLGERLLPSFQGLASGIETRVVPAFERFFALALTGEEGYLDELAAKTAVSTTAFDELGVSIGDLGGVQLDQDNLTLEIGPFEQVALFINEQVIPSLATAASVVKDVALVAFQQWGNYLNDSAIPAITDIRDIVAESFGLEFDNAIDKVGGEEGITEKLIGFTGVIFEQVLPALSDLAVSFTAEAVPAIRDFVGWIGNEQNRQSILDFVDATTNLVEALNSFVGVGETVAAALGVILSPAIALYNVFTDIEDALRGISVQAGLTSTAISTVNSLGGGRSSGSWGGGSGGSFNSGSSVSGIEGLARGAVLDRATFLPYQTRDGRPVVAGEAGREIVAPMNDMARTVSLFRQAGSIDRLVSQLVANGEFDRIMTREFSDSTPRPAPTGGGGQVVVHQTVNVPDVPGMNDDATRRQFIQQMRRAAEQAAATALKVRPLKPGVSRRQDSR